MFCSKTSLHLSSRRILSELIKVFEAVEQLEKKDFKVAQQAKKFIIERLKITPEISNAFNKFFK